ncbi:hypothetical protein D3C73_905230 [compost metagenome]
MLRHLSRRDDNSVIPGSRYHLNGEDGIPPNGIEMIIDPDIFPFKQVPPNVKQQRFHIIFTCFRHLFGKVLPHRIRMRKSGSVHFSIRIQRKRFQAEKVRWNHVGR